VLVAVAVHVLVAAPWLRRNPSAKAAAPRPVTELPIEVAAAPAERPARRAKREKPQPNSSPAPKTAAPTTPAKHTLPAPTANAAPAAAAAVSPAATPPPAKSPSLPSAPREPQAFVALANQPLIGESSTGALLIHSGNLRDGTLAADLGKQLRAQPTLSTLFAGALDPLRDCDELLLARSADNGLGLLLVQYNAPRYKVRVAAAQSGADYALPARDLLALGGGAQGFAASAPKDFRLPAGAEDEALSAYAKPPQTLTLSALSKPARWLTLQVRDDGSGSLLASAADDANIVRTPIAKSELKALVSELLAAFR
jgi:hypothetical protein